MNDFLNDIDSAIQSGDTSVDVSIPDATITETSAPNNKDTDIINDLNTIFDGEQTQTEETPKVVEKSKTEEETKPQETPKVEDKSKVEDKPISNLQLDRFLKEDKDGNLVDNNGEVIAPKGKARAAYEKLKEEGRNHRDLLSNASLKLVQLGDKFKELQLEYQKVQKTSVDPLQGIVKETGFNENEARDALNIIKLYKTDPITAIKNMLTQAKINGIDISKIGANISVDPSLIKTTMRQLLAENKTVETEQTKVPQQITQEQALQTAQEFLQRNPTSAEYVKHISAAKQKYPNMSLDEIWIRMQKVLRNKAYEEAKTVTMHNNDPVKTETVQETPKRKIQIDTSNDANMSFDDIAKSILKGN